MAKDIKECPEEVHIKRKKHSVKRRFVLHNLFFSLDPKRLGADITEV